MIVDSFRNGKLEIDLKDILDIKLDGGTLEVYVNRQTTEKKSLFYYLMPNMDNMYQFPGWGRKDEMNDLVDTIRCNISCTPQVEDIRQLSNLCGSYLFILAGIPFMFLLANLVPARLEHSLILFGIYFAVFLLYIPENAVGKKLIVFIHNRKTNQS